MATDAGNSTGAKVALAAIVVGAIVSVVGIAGAAADWGSSTKSAQTAPQSSPQSSAPVVTSATETALEFVVHLDTAIKNHDTTFLFQRLHPAVIARYGDAQCRAFVPRLRDHYVVTGTSSRPAQYAYASDGKTTLIANVVGVPVRIVAPDGTATNSTLHTVKVAGNYRYFVDCTQ